MEFFKMLKSLRDWLKFMGTGWQTVNRTAWDFVANHKLDLLLLLDHLSFCLFFRAEMEVLVDQEESLFF